MVLKLTSDMADFGFAIAMHGSSGTLEVRNMSIVAVRQRSWVPAATIVVVMSGFALFTSLVLSHSERPKLVRALLASTVLVAATWILVFPQTKGYFSPIPTTFSVGEIKPPPAPPEPLPPAKPPKPASEPAIPKPPQPTKPPTSPQTATELETPNAEAPPKAEAPEVKPRDSSWLYRTLKEVDKRFGPAHLVLFTGLTLLVLIITGKGSQWRLPLALACLAELVPELTDHLGGWDDWGDLIANLSGVGLAVLLWFRLPFLKRFHQKPSA